MPQPSPIRCLIIDDEPIARRIIRTHLGQVEGYEVVGECRHALEGFSLLQTTPIDLLLLDIQMPRLSGLDFLKSLRQKPSVILITAHREWALEGFELDVVDYMLKPVAFERFLMALDKYRQRSQSGQLPAADAAAQEYLTIRADRKSIRLQLATVTYIESMSDYLKIHTTDGLHITKEKISTFEKALPATFLRIHRSFIINLHHLKAFTPEVAEVAGKQLPISRSLRQPVLEAINAL